MLKIFHKFFQEVWVFWETVYAALILPPRLHGMNSLDMYL